MMSSKMILAAVVAHEEAMQLRILQIEQQNTLIIRRMKKLRKTIRHNNMWAAALSAELSIQRPRRLWAVKRFGTFWELDVPQNNDKFFKNAFRADRNCFNILVEKLVNLQKQDTHFRETISLEKRIAIALYALGSSAEYRTVGRLFGVSKSSVCNILHEFCSETCRVLAPEYLPSDFLTQGKLEECVKGFEAIEFPQCFGAIDGCHIEIMPPADEVVDYHNYKGWNSVVLFALVDYRYRFMYINIRCPGRCHDTKIFDECSLKKILFNSPLLKNSARKISNVMVPVVVLGDSAFPFSELVMKPYPFGNASTLEQKTFNYFLAKARRVVENSFGHLKARFRRLGKGLDNNPSKINCIVKCCCILHNFFNDNNSAISEKWLTELTASEKPQPEYNNTTGNIDASAEQIRKAIALHLTSLQLEEEQAGGVSGFEY